MRSVIQNGELQFDKHLLDERKILDLGAKWFLVQEKNHAYILIRNTFLAQRVLEEIEPNGKVVAVGYAEFTQNSSWVCWVMPQLIVDYFQSFKMVIEEDSKGFFVTSLSEKEQYEKEIKDLSDHILSLLEDSN